MPYTLPQLIVSSCFGVILFPLYIFVLIQLITPSLNKPFRAFFFKICIFIGFVVSFWSFKIELQFWKVTQRKVKVIKIYIFLKFGITVPFLQRKLFSKKR